MANDEKRGGQKDRDRDEKARHQGERGGDQNESNQNTDESENM